MHRRRVLAAAGTLAATAAAGCLTGSPASDTTDRETPDPPKTETTTDTPAVPLSVSLDRYQPGVVAMTSPDSIGDRGALFLDIDGDDAPARTDFRFRFDGSSYVPVDPDDVRLWRAYGNREDAYGVDGRDGWLLFDLPDSGAAADARLSWPGGEWTPTRSLRERLAAGFDFSVDYDFPETVEHGERPTVSLAVTNDADAPARYLAALNRAGPRVAHAPIETISFVLDPGETRTWTYEDDYFESDDVDESEVGDGDPDMTYYVDSASENREFQVRIV
ncbi:hypothetical protein U3A55_08725 [Salarchaeum sp. III]|uniref:hypothetical protein n=1 Tax=Salarchaeum sp. III TaxID=3107927 RepID=UPI002EDA52F1